MSFTFGVREADDAPPIVTTAQNLADSIADFLDVVARTNGLEERYPVSSTSLAAMPSMLSQIIDEFDPSSEINVHPDVNESVFGRGRLFTPNCFD